MKIFILLLLSVVSVLAHQKSVSYLTLEQAPTELRGNFDIAVRDLEFALGLDGNSDGQVTWGEIRSNSFRISEGIFRKLIIVQAGQPVAISSYQLLTRNHANGSYIVISWRAPVANAAAVSVSNDFFFDLDPGHQCLVYAGGTTRILTKENRIFELLAKSASFFTLVKEGVRHIFEGVDHICFLLALLLCAVWKRTPTGWRPMDNFKEAFLAVLKVVTAFTVAHSLTLALAAARLVVIPSALVESSIAVSVVLAALNNVRPIWSDRAWPIAFAFGLIHGLGFASVFGEIAPTAGSILRTLLGFNLGVELGQLCMVLIVIPAAFAFRASAFYRWFAVRLGSIAIGLVGTIWFIERAFDVAVFSSVQ
jgi:hypothetical protein